MKSKIILWVLVLIAVVISLFTNYKDALNIWDSLSIMVWTMWFLFVLVVIYSFVPKERYKARVVIICWFMFSYITVTSFILYIAYIVFNYQPLEEAAIIYIVVPYMLFWSSLAGIIFGVSIVFLSNLIERKRCR